ncbi:MULTISPECIES: peptidoglycan-binding domain-containing protein [unclassified Sedimentibacter]|uniref:peptidoglycan-binding domain-containing protein n=1 Tax=unclassified Sedimentibacter TaxID=2649220 RepID=UPI0027DEBF73|nr:peptidoglycan-binding protein [Sedimentibacter sp. MB35-C1]WMJ78896.1 peptidoglycan-binding protein [Sedimentibacter sp. MB35-C1]
MKSKLDAVKAANPVLEIQFKLRDISNIHQDIPKVLPTGKFNGETELAVKEFQKKFNLPATGKVDFSTWSTLNKEHANCMHCINTPSPVCCFPKNVESYKRVDSCNLIYILQIILKNYHKKYKNYPDIDLNGVFDERTEEAVKMFQRSSYLLETGKLDRQTWNLLNKIHEICNLYE